MRFVWKNRTQCLTRIYVTMKCTVNLSLEKAVELALRKKDLYTGHYLFCWNPELISDSELSLLTQDAATMYRKFSRMGVPSHDSHIAALSKAGGHEE